MTNRRLQMKTKVRSGMDLRTGMGCRLVSRLRSRLRGGLRGGLRGRGEGFFCIAQAELWMRWRCSLDLGWRAFFMYYMEALTEGRCRPNLGRVARWSHYISTEPLNHPLVLLKSLIHRCMCVYSQRVSQTPKPIPTHRPLQTA
jgi:hypothetical protein